MIKNETGAYYGLLGLSAAFTILALLTLLPYPGASRPNPLGYWSLCSFTPASTALCALLAAITCTVRIRAASHRAASMRYRPMILPIAVAVLLVAVAAFFGLRFARLYYGL